MPSIGTLSALPSQRTGIDHRIVAVCVESDEPLFVQTPNGAIFSIDGLSDRQRQQFLILLPYLIHTRVRFQYRQQNELGQAVDALDELGMMAAHAIEDDIGITEEQIASLLKCVEYNLLTTQRKIIAAIDESDGNTH